MDIPPRGSRSPPLPPQSEAHARRAKDISHADTYPERPRFTARRAQRRNVRPASIPALNRDLAQAHPGRLATRGHPHQAPAQPHHTPTRPERSRPEATRRHRSSQRREDATREHTLRQVGDARAPPSGARAAAPHADVSRDHGPQRAAAQHPSCRLFRRSTSVPISTVGNDSPLSHALVTHWAPSRVRPPPIGAGARRT